MKTSIRVGLGLSSALLAIGFIIWFVGVEEFLNTAGNADPTFSLISVLFASMWLVMWSGAFYVVANSLDIDMSMFGSFRTYATVMFANNVTPFAHLGGEPVAAGFISKVVENDYEKCLGALSSVSVVHFVPSLLFFTGGFGYMFITGNSIPDSLDGLVVAFLILTVAIVVAGLIVYKFRERTKSSVSGFIFRLLSVLGRLPKFPEYEREEIDKIVDGYFSSFAEVGANKRVVALAVLLSTTGVFCQALGLWFALQAVGVDIRLVIPIIAFPIAGLASALPLPGGAGGIEAVLISIIVAFTSATVPGATAGVILVRTAIFWLPVTVGSINIGVALAME